MITLQIAISKKRHMAIPKIRKTPSHFYSNPPPPFFPTHPFIPKNLESSLLKQCFATSKPPHLEMGCLDYVSYFSEETFVVKQPYSSVKLISLKCKLWYGDEQYNWLCQVMNLIKAQIEYAQYLLTTFLTPLPSTYSTPPSILKSRLLFVLSIS